jgi:hypothetical protein
MNTNPESTHDEAPTYPTPIDLDELLGDEE